MKRVLDAAMPKSKTVEPRPPVMRTKPLSMEEVRVLMAKGREVRRELERRVREMQQIDPVDAARRAR